MVRLRLPVDATAEDNEARAAVISLVSPMGIELSLVEAGPQTIEGRNADQPAAIWLAILLEGSAVLDDGRSESPIEAGDVVFGPTGFAARLSLKTRFRLLFITAPRVALDHRLTAPRSLAVGRMSASKGLNHVFSGLLRAVADTLESLDGDQLRPVELAITEFLLACLSDGVSEVQGPEALRRAQLHRVHQTIERLLAEPDLSLARVAAVEGVSTRYLQKLFAAAGGSFTHYVRLRRLERCRLDLISARYSEGSISSICFRWGFNGSPHFSRAFRQQYGVSPREYRRLRSLEPAGDPSANDLPGAQS
jgi:AraC-like DNA-binding protein